MRLLVASSSPPDRGSGINAYCRNLVEALVADKHELHFLSPSPKDDTWLRQHGVRHVASDQGDDPLQAAAVLAQYIADHHIEGLINNDNSLLQSIAPLVDCPFLAVGHMGKSNVAALACFNNRWVDHVVAISSDMQRVFTGRYRIPVEKCPVVHNGVVDRSSDVREARADSGTLRVVFAGGYSRNKGGRLIARAIRGSPNAWQNVHIDWFGEVPPKVQKGLGPLANIAFHGRAAQDEFHAVLRQADVLLLPSKVEGCPMVLLEAMSFGVASIVSDGKGAMRWLVDSGREGYVCGLKSWPGQAARCIAFLAGHREHLDSMRQAARMRFEKELRSELVARRMLELLRYPTVERGRRPDRITVLKWHRPLVQGTTRAPLLDRLFIRAGWLRRAGYIDLRKEA